MHATTLSNCEWASFYFEEAVYLVILSFYHPVCNLDCVRMDFFVPVVFVGPLLSLFNPFRTAVPFWGQTT